MTALSLNLLHNAKPLDAGVPLDGLPALEAGRTVPQAFADVLNKASPPGNRGGGEPVGQPPLRADKPGLAVPVADDPSTPAKAAKPDQPIPVSEPEDADAANGKALPSVRPDVAALKPADCEPEPMIDDDKGGSGPIASGEKPQAVPVMDRDTNTPSDKPIEVSAGGPAQSEPPVDAIVLPVPPGVAQQLSAPTVLPAIISLARTGAETTTGQAAPRIAATESEAAATLAGFVRGGGASAQTAHDMTGGGHSRGGEPDAEPAARAATGRNADASATASQTPAAARGAQEALQTGLSLQVRAADRPIAASEASPLTASAFGTTPSLGALAPTALLSPTGQPGLAGQTGPLPQFPDLSAMVDRIAAARDSAGSASATISVAHKELGNLSLTFEASGRALNVEVAAQDSDTQRALAAAIAADRPQLRGAETLANTQTQTQSQAQGQASQSGASAQGSDSGARQSGEAGNGGSDRQPGRRESDRNGDGQPRGGAHRSTDPKSEGGIYA